MPYAIGYLDVIAATKAQDDAIIKEAKFVGNIS